MTEIRVLDTYWSDHCRHTTFSTELKECDSLMKGTISEPIENTYKAVSDCIIVRFLQEEKTSLSA